MPASKIELGEQTILIFGYKLMDPQHANYSKNAVGDCSVVSPQDNRVILE